MNRFKFTPLSARDQSYVVMKLLARAATEVAADEIVVADHYLLKTTDPERRGALLASIRERFGCETITVPQLMLYFSEAFGHELVDGQRDDL